MKIRDKFKIEKGNNDLPNIILEKRYTWDDVVHDLEDHQIFLTDTSAPVYYSEKKNAFYIGHKGVGGNVSAKGFSNIYSCLSFINVPYHISNPKEMYQFKHMRYMRCEDDGEHKMFINARRTLHNKQMLKENIKKKVEKFEKRFIDFDEIVNEEQVYYASNGHYLENLKRLKKHLCVGMTILCIDDDIGPVAGGKIQYKLKCISDNDVTLIDEDGSEIHVYYEVLIRKTIENRCRKYDGRYRFDHIYLERLPF